MFEHQTPITMDRAAQELSKLTANLAGVVRDAQNAVLKPTRGQHPAITYTDAFARLYVAAAELSREQEKLARRLNFTARTQSVEPSARSLEAVLADIEAEGHMWELHGPHYPTPDAGGYMTTRLADTKATDEDNDFGSAAGETAIDAAEKRLADIRALRAAPGMLANLAGGSADVAPSDPVGTIAEAFAARRPSPAEDGDSEGIAFLLPGERLTSAELAQLQRESAARETAASEAPTSYDTEEA